jgi:hypothetical protein
MAFHLLSASRLVADLADDNVAPREQALYFAATFIAWMIPGYFYIYPVRLSLVFWYVEFLILVLVNLMGAFYCLRQCRIEPQRRFLVDCTCLMAPITVVALPVTWLGFYAAAGLVGKAWPTTSLDDLQRVQDMLVSVVVVGQLAWIYRRTGKYMARAAEMRASALAPPAAAVTLG